MAKTNNLGDFVTDIANTIRTETQTETLINPQSFSSKISAFGNDLKKQNQELETLLGVYPKEIDVTYGVKLDKSILTSGLWESYTDEAVGLEPAYMDFDNDTFVDNGWLSRYPFNQIKPCLLKDGQVVGYLNPNNYAEFEDGTPATINDASAGQVMIEIPYMAYHISKDDANIYVKVSSKLKDGFIDDPFWYKGAKHDKIYVGAYLAPSIYYTTKGFPSLSGVGLNSLYAINFENSYQYLSIHGAGFEMLPYSVLILLQCLYLIMFRNTNSQKALGYGYGTVQTTYTTGKMNTSGMYYGKSASGGVKCFGIEDIYGARGVICSGFYIDSSNNPRFIDTKNPNSSYDPAYYEDFVTTDTPITMTGGSYGRVANDIYGDPHIGFFYLTKGTDTNKGFCDYSMYRSNTICCEAGGTQSNAALGMFNQTTVLKSNQTYTRAVRLVYYPQS